MNKILKAYRYADHCDSFCSSIIYHFTSKEAKKLGVNCVGYEGDYVDIQCKRYEDADKFAGDEEAPRIENDDVKLRLLGWSYEGEYSCDTCGLHAMGMDEFEVCNECGRCPECGHDKNCYDLDGHN